MDVSKLSLVHELIITMVPPSEFGPDFGLTFTNLLKKLFQTNPETNEKLMCANRL